jgi:hypothetical protein
VEGKAVRVDARGERGPQRPAGTTSQHSLHCWLTRPAFVHMDEGPRARTLYPCLYRPVVIMACAVALSSAWLTLQPKLQGEDRRRRTKVRRVQLQPAPPAILQRAASLVSPVRCHG